MNDLPRPSFLHSGSLISRQSLVLIARCRGSGSARRWISATYRGEGGDKHGHIARDESRRVNIKLTRIHEKSTAQRIKAYIDLPPFSFYFKWLPRSAGLVIPII